nr:hypothetical protein [Aeromonas veronii]
MPFRFDTALRLHYGAFDFHWGWLLSVLATAITLLLLHGASFLQAKVTGTPALRARGIAILLAPLVTFFYLLAGWHLVDLQGYQLTGLAGQPFDGNAVLSPLMKGGHPPCRRLAAQLPRATAALAGAGDGRAGATGERHCRLA